jgi:hypothetical protein
MIYVCVCVCVYIYIYLCIFIYFSLYISVYIYHVSAFVFEPGFQYVARLASNWPCTPDWLW